MTRLPFVLVLVGGVAAAQPVLHPEGDPCRVTVVLAPDDVRSEIESWVRAEPHCQRELEVRVVPTEDGGLYLQARDREGRVRERIVPDAQSAAVLVVSWMADDSIRTLPARDTHAEILQPPTTAQPPVIDQASDGDAGITLRLATPHGDPPTHRWLSLGAVASERSGIRGQLDVAGGARWTLGIAGGWRAGHDVDDSVGQARLVIGTAHSFGRLSLHAQLGVGVDSTTRRTFPDHVARIGDGDVAEETHETSVVPSAEVGVFGHVKLGDRWGLFGGPLVESTFDRDRPTISVFLGVSRGL